MLKGGNGCLEDGGERAGSSWLPKVKVREAPHKKCLGKVELRKAELRRRENYWTTLESEPEDHLVGYCGCSRPHQGDNTNREYHF